MGPSRGVALILHKGILATVDFVLASMSLTSPMLTRLGARLNTVVGVARPSTISLRASFSTEDSKEAAPSGPFKEVDSWTPPTTDLDKDLDVPDANGKAHVECMFQTNKTKHNKVEEKQPETRRKGLNNPLFLIPP